MKINIHPDQESSHKQQLIKKFTVLFASYQIERIKQYFAEDIEWRLVGDTPIKGKEKFSAALEKMNTNKAIELTIHNIIADFKEAAISGEMKMSDDRVFGFSDFYELSTNDKIPIIKKITSYVVQIN